MNKHTHTIAQFFPPYTKNRAALCEASSNDLSYFGRAALEHMALFWRAYTPRNSSTNQLQRIQARIDTLQNYAATAPIKPLFRIFYTASWYAKGDKVVFVRLPGRSSAFRIRDMLFAGTIVYPPDRSGDHVTIVTRRKVHRGSYLNGYGFDWFGESFALLHEWEFYYLREHQQYAEQFATIGVRPRQFDSLRFRIFLHALFESAMPH